MYLYRSDFDGPHSPQHRRPLNALLYVLVLRNRPEYQIRPAHQIHQQNYFQYFSLGKHI